MSEQLGLDFSAPPSELIQLWTPDDVYLNASRSVIDSMKEDRRVERKSARIQAKDLGDYLSMYANTQPHGGVVFIGIEKDGEITGCSKASVEHLNKLETVRRYCGDARHEFKRVVVRNSRGEEDFILLLRVFYREDRLVETSDGEAYVREGDEKRRLSEPEKREMRIAKGEIDYELEDVSLDFTSEFDHDLIRQFTVSYAGKRGLRRNYTTAEILVLNRLGRMHGGKFKPNLACAILFAKDVRGILPGARIRFIRYEGHEEAFGRNLNSTLDERIEGPLATQLIAIEKLVSAQMRNFTRLGKDGRFATRSEYPKDAWLEAIVNACVHRSYNLRQMNIFVKMFDDKFVVESPGGFLPPTRVETVYDAHNPRNPHLMEALYYLDFVKCAYEGTRRMRDEMQQANLPEPEFAQKEVGSFAVHVTLRNDVAHRKAFVDSEVSELIDEKAFALLSDEEKLIANFVAEKGSLNVTGAQLLVNRDWRSTKAIFDRLVSIRLLEIQSRSGKAKDPRKRYVLRSRNVQQTSR